MSQARGSGWLIRASSSHSGAIAPQHGTYAGLIRSPKWRAHIFSGNVKCTAIGRLDLTVAV